MITFSDFLILFGVVYTFTFGILYLYFKEIKERRNNNNEKDE